MSLTPEPGYVPPATPAPTVLDERAAVGNLSRNIVIQSIDDDAWRSKGFGVHLMFMDLKSKIVLDGVEIHRAGQAGITGRYPIHWHRLSYSDTGVALGDATGHVMQNSTVWESANRCVVIHATNGVTVKNNICQDVKGHAFFLEDAVERRNIFEGNLALMMRIPAAANKLQIHEGDIFQGGPAGFWLTNPDNIVRGNSAGDAAGNGFWMAFPERPLGSSKSVPLYPNRMLHGVFEYNTAYTSRGPGVMLEWAPIDDAGNVKPMVYMASANPPSLESTDRRSFEIKGITSYKNLDGAYRNRVGGANYVEWVSADNVGVSMAGSGNTSTISRGLFIGQSLNNYTLVSKVTSGEILAAFATYHSSFTMKENTVVNFPFIEGQTSGMFAMTDYYIFGVDTGQLLNVNNRLINSHPGQRSLPPNLDGRPLNSRNWTYSGAIWDPQGMWGPKNNFLVYDVPFLTSSGNCQYTDPIGKNGKSCDGQFYGVGSFQTDFDDNPFTFKSPIQIIRTSAEGTEIGRWAVGDGEVASFFGNMRHFAAQPNGTYSLTFPGKPLPTKFAMDVGNAHRIGDSFIFSVSYDGRIPVTGYTVAGFRYGRFNFWSRSDIRAGSARWFEPAGSMSEVVQSTGNRIWQDTKNNTVWLRVQGGIPFPNNNQAVPFIDDETYGALSVILHPK
ncbi:MAG: right-handed parallel beta-helix repeat-containing protein, partial [Rhodoferax sp.]|nr:right-handed parallel beta-helix repeat-containing protein [Rhodoferax sp.]